MCKKPEDSVQNCSWSSHWRVSLFKFTGKLFKLITDVLGMGIVAMGEKLLKEKLGVEFIQSCQGYLARFWWRFCRFYTILSPLYIICSLSTSTMCSSLTHAVSGWIDQFYTLLQALQTTYLLLPLDTLNLLVNYTVPKKSGLLLRDRMHEVGEGRMHIHIIIDLICRFFELSKAFDT